MTTTTTRSPEPRISDSFAGRSPLLDSLAAPLGFKAGDANLSRYVGNSPPNATDPSGLTFQATVPKGTPDNNYEGLGEWVLMDESAFKAFIAALLKNNKAGLPPNWLTQAKRGCVGLGIVRMGPDKNGKAPLTPFHPDGVIFADEDAAMEYYKQQSKKGPYILVAVQMPLKPGINPQDLNQFGDEQVELTDLGGIFDFSKPGDFNVATWFNTGYWEYMSHQCVFGIDPEMPPVVFHTEDLPQLGDKYGTVYLVVPINQWEE